MKTRLNVTVELDQDDINDALLLKELLKANNSLKEECIASDEVLKASCRHKFFKAELLLFPFVSEVTLNSAKQKSKMSNECTVIYLFVRSTNSRGEHMVEHLVFTRISVRRVLLGLLAFATDFRNRLLTHPKSSNKIIAVSKRRIKPQGCSQREFGN